MTSLTFALDFDDTFTADPKLWAEFINNAQERGHKFYCVTARRDTDANKQFIEEAFGYYYCKIPIIFSNLTSKVEHMDKLGISIDIWIDDSPYALVHGY